MSDRELFLAALDLPVSERPRYLVDNCSDDATKMYRVLRLLDAHEAAGSFLEQPADAGPTLDYHPAPLPHATAAHRTTKGPGTVIDGRYLLLEPIGEGGMGLVWLAQQTEPVRRTVALKLIRAELDSKTVLARFETERQAIALMDHPNIARVFDAGETDDGGPYFVMELVKGVPVTQYCDEHRLTPRQRLELFVPICQAIQHAHQKGIIHRDIKPSNVLIAEYDGRPVPKIIDFGVAKATSQSLSKEAERTNFGMVVGTPEYMSPEQASLDQLDVDTRSDVYALGVLLYELLTGTTPVDRRSLKQAALLEILRIVREDEAPRPSVKLSTAEGLPSLASNRGTEPNALTKLLRGELDWVVLKALEKDRNRRYETATALARDVERYLADEVVEARSPTAGYRLRKFVRRNRGRVIAAALVVLALVAGVIGTSISMVRAESARRDAEDARTIAVAEQVKTQEALREATHQRERADANVGQLHETVKQFGTALEQDPVLQSVDAYQTRMKVLQVAAEVYTAIVNSRPNDPSVRRECGVIWTRLAMVQWESQSPATSQDSYRRAVEQLTVACQLEPSNDLSAYLLGDGLRGYVASHAESRLSVSAPLYEQAVAVLSRDVSMRTTYPRTVEFVRMKALTLHSWAARLIAEQQFARAEAKLAEAERALQSVPEAAKPAILGEIGEGHRVMAVLRRAQGRLDDSERESARAVELFTQVMATKKTDLRKRWHLSGVYLEWAAVCQEAKRPADARAKYEKMVELLDPLVKQFPTVAEYKRRLDYAQAQLKTLDTSKK